MRGLLELLAWDREARCELVRVELGVAALTTGGQHVREERLKDAEALGGNRADGALAAVGGVVDATLACEQGRIAVVGLP